MHEHLIIDATGDTIDAIPLCSDACHRDYAGDEYDGWNGAHETEFTQWCASCGVVIPGADEDDDGQPCDCQRYNVVVNRFPSDEGERCKHGHWVQLPASYLTARL